MLEAKQSGNVVEDFTIGNTRIKICDDFCRTRTSGEVKEILNRVARRTVGSLTAAATPDYGCAYRTSLLYLAPHQKSIGA